MFKQITSLEGNEIYLMISLGIFIVFFVVVAFLVIFMRKDYTEYMTHIPLNDEEEQAYSINQQDN